MPDQSAPPASSGGEERVFVIWLCDECGWHILDDNSAGEGQPCEAHFIDAEIPEHGPTRRIEVTEARSPSSETTSLRDEVARLRAKLGDGEELLGRYGAGGSAAGLVPAIHNLASRAESAEAESERLRGALRELVRWQPHTEIGLDGLHPQHREAVELARSTLQNTEEKT